MEVMQVMVGRGCLLGDYEPSNYIDGSCRQNIIEACKRFIDRAILIVSQWPIVLGFELPAG